MACLLTEASTDNMAIMRSSSEFAESKVKILSGHHDLTAGLPSEHILHVFSKRVRLQAETQAVRDSLGRNELDGNQWILVLGLSKCIIDRLGNDERFFDGIDFRFQWEGTTGLIKIVPSPLHERINSDFTMLVSDKLAAMGIPRDDRRWGLATEYRPTIGSKGKQGDQTFLPLQRQPPGRAAVNWPTLVLEIGVTESKTKLEEDAKWWFNNSGGRVRIVLVVSVTKSRVAFEKWQLLPPEASSKITRHYITSLRQRTLHMPPLELQAGVNQRCFCAQEVTVDKNGVVEAPMILPFRALFDRDTGPNEADVSTTALDFREITAKAF